MYLFWWGACSDLLPNFHSGCLFSSYWVLRVGNSPFWKTALSQMWLLQIFSPFMACRLIFSFSCYMCKFPFPWHLMRLSDCSYIYWLFDVLCEMPIQAFGVWWGFFWLIFILSWLFFLLMCRIFFFFGMFLIRASQYRVLCICIINIFLAGFFTILMVSLDEQEFLILILYKC